MATCLLGLGSNVGDRAATIQQSLLQIDALPDVQLARHSQNYVSRPIGGPADQGEFLNAAAVIETKIPPLPLLSELQRIETFHGRRRDKRWAERTLDIDLLLYDNEIAETEMLTLPHPRMSYRRFVLEPCAEIAPRMLHPVIGWPLEQLLLHLDAASDQVAIVSPLESARRDVASLLATGCGARPIDGPTFASAENHWPAASTTWLAIPTSGAPKRSTVAKTTTLPYAAAAFPKLTLLLDPPHGAQFAGHSDWSAIVRKPGRGPTLRLPPSDAKLMESEIRAAIDAVWSI